jgi:hypothetical protein
MQVMGIIAQVDAQQPADIGGRQTMPQHAVLRSFVKASVQMVLVGTLREDEDDGRDG